MTPRLTIAMVLYKSADFLAECLRSVRPAVERGWAELVAADNATPDDSVEILHRELPSARLIRLGANRGFAAGVNAAFAHARGSYWLMLNPDVVVPVHGLEDLVEWMDRHRAVGAASPDIVGRNGGSAAPGRAFPSTGRALLEASRLHRLLPRTARGRVLRGPYWAGGDQLNAGWVPGTAMIVRREVATMVGPLDETLFMYGEDIEWCWRIHRAGWRTGVCAGTRFIHEASSSADRSFGEQETDVRIASGIDTACHHMYGAAHARAIAAATALALALEAAGPRRDESDRRAARTAARTWWSLARRPAVDRREGGQA